jgi:internalin A
MKEKKILKSIIIIGMLFISFSSYAQTYALPDTNLRNKLIADYPSVMTGNLLNITAAGNLTGTLNLSNSGILNADGIQYFIKISSLDLRSNQLNVLPDISGLTLLIALYLSNNQLVSAPSLSSFPSLIDFQAAYNKLTSLPSFTTNTNLNYLYCQNNKLTSLPDISMLTNLKVLDIGFNNFNQLQDLSSLVNLQQLHVHKTGIDTIIGLSALLNLNSIYAWGNHIRDLSGLNTNTNLVIFQVFNNDLKDLPVLSNKPSLSNVSFINNALTFEDILPLTSHPGFGSFDYSPQKQIPLSSYTVREKDSVSFNLFIDQGIFNNLYTWYKDGNILTTNSTGIYSISSVNYPDSGTYYVKITNPGLTGLSLQSGTGSLHIKPNLKLNSYAIISPNGDGVMDTYYIEAKGSIKIFDLGKNLIKELATPAEWDGRKADGSFADDGYYAIVINEKEVIHITVVK